MNIAVLGAGMVGRAIALDLVSSFNVTSFDVSEQNLRLLKERNSSVQIQQTELRQYDKYVKWLTDFDIVVTAVPGFIGFEVLKTVIDCGKNVADISFFHENALQLDRLAREKNVTVITDIGVAPGLSNLILGRYNQEMNVANFECYVGGLPRVRKKPFEYKASFSPADVIEEYTRPARLKENGQVVTKPALTEAGFFDENEIEINGIKISPRKFSSKMLFNDWKLATEEEELTIMKVIIEGEKNEASQHVEYNLLDRYDTKTKTSSMSRTTGYACTAAVNLIDKKMFTERGVFPPELVGKHKSCFDFVMSYLKERGVNCNAEVREKKRR